MDLVTFIEEILNGKLHFLCGVDSSSSIIDYYSNVYHNHIVIGDFNLEPSQMYLETFMATRNYFNLIKNNTCFKGPGSCIDLILTNRKYCFQGTSSFETGLSDHHHLIYYILKKTLEKEEPKQVIYRNYTHFQWQNFENDLKSSLKVMFATFLLVCFVCLSQTRKNVSYFTSKALFVPEIIKF